MNNKSSGVLIHPISFPGRYGCGDLGQEAKEVIDWLHKAGQSYLQILSIGPTGYGNSPYQSFSAFAGNPYLISLEEFIKKDYLKRSELKDYPNSNPVKVDYQFLKRNYYYFK